MLLLLVLFLFIFCVYIYFTRTHNYWRKKHVKYDPPVPLFGTHMDMILGKKSIVTLSAELYNKYPNEKVVGCLRGMTPELIIRDLDIVRQIINVDFTYFSYRGLGRDPKKEPILSNLFHVDGDTWKLLRQRLTPAFTTAKLKAMFPLIISCAERLITSLGDGGERDAREVMARFTTDFIGSCGFGIEMDSINNERSQFRELGKLIFSKTLLMRIKILLYELFPEIKSILYIGNPLVEEELTHIVKRIREQRGCKPSGRNDFVDLLLELETKGKIVGESILRQNPDGTPATVEMEMDLACQVAQVFVFFAAGFETSSSATSFALHELAYNPDVQKKVQDELDKVMLKYDNKLCYDSIAEMTYLDMMFKESMRKFPSLGVLNRVCVKKYTIPGLNITVDPGVRMIVPVQAIHMDEQYYDNPEEFRPERFTPEAVQARHKYSYLPFGDGPRVCVGARLGLMQSLAGLAAILYNFTVTPAPSSKREMQVNPYSNVVQGLKGGLPLIFTPRKKTQ